MSDTMFVTIAPVLQDLPASSPIEYAVEANYAAPLAAWNAPWEVSDDTRDYCGAVVFRFPRGTYTVPVDGRTLDLFDLIGKTLSPEQALAIAHHGREGLRR